MAPWFPFQGSSWFSLPKRSTWSSFQRGGGFQPFKSDALFLNDPKQKTNLDLAGFEEYIASWFILPKVDFTRVEEFLTSFNPTTYQAEVEETSIYITEEYVAACLNLLDSTDNSSGNMYRVSPSTFAVYKEMLSLCFKGRLDPGKVPDKGWKKSTLHHRVIDVVNFLHQRLYLATEDVDYVDEEVLLATLGVMKGVQFKWAKHLSRRIRDDIVNYLNGDNEYRSTTRLRSAQYISMLIDFQVERPPSPDCLVTILDYEDMLLKKDEKLVMLEKENLSLHMKVVPTTTEATEIQNVKSKLAQADNRVLYLQVQRQKELEYGKAMNESNIKLKSQIESLEHELEELKDQDVAIQESIDGEPMSSDGTPWAAVWKASDDLYLGQFSNLFDNWYIDYPYPKWEALWWIAKDYGQSPPPLKHPSLKAYYSRHSLGMFQQPPKKIINHPDFYRLCERRWKWSKNGELNEVYYNWPVIPLDLSSSKACSTSYHHFYEQHKDHRDPVCFRASIFCSVLAHWCSSFDLIIDANVGGHYHQDMMLFTKLNYSSCRVQRVLELMCQSQFLFDSHRNMVIDNANRFGIANGWRGKQHSGGRLDHRKGHYERSYDPYGKKRRVSP